MFESFKAYLSPPDAGDEAGSVILLKDDKDQAEFVRDNVPSRRCRRGGFAGATSDNVIVSITTSKLVRTSAMTESGHHATHAQKMREL
jgi:hypothetical protein